MIRAPAKARKLTRREADRYCRNMLVREWEGEKGQLKLKDSTVLVVGAGGSGSSLLLYLAAAGVGTIRVCDGDSVEITNLNRQVLHDERRLGRNKARSAASTLRRLNSDIEIVAIPHHVTAANIDRLTQGCNLICCAADSRDAMRLLGHHARASGIPVVWGGGYYMGGFLTFIDPPTTPCIACLLAASDQTIEEYRQGRVAIPDDAVYSESLKNPVVGAAAGAAGAIQAMEAIKYLVGFGANLLGVMLRFQMGGAGMAFNLYDVDKIRRPDCPDCGVQ